MARLLGQFRGVVPFRPGHPVQDRHRGCVSSWSPELLTAPVPSTRATGEHWTTLHELIWCQVRNRRHQEQKRKDSMFHNAGKLHGLMSHEGLKLSQKWWLWLLTLFLVICLCLPKNYSTTNSRSWQNLIEPPRAFVNLITVHWNIEIWFKTCAILKHMCHVQKTRDRYSAMASPTRAVHLGSH